MRKSLAHFYAEDMYEGDLSPVSAEVVVPLVMSLVHPSSVLDIGCGRGAWLSAFSANGVKRILGIDGDYIDRASLLIPPECFRSTDLSGGFEIPAGKFDLATCLEVAEHLQPRYASHLVRQLVSAAPVVLFSAAPPGQRGASHVNCQPLSYWRALFEQCKFRMLDPVRPRIRDDRRVAWWYRQNIAMFAAPEAISANPALTACGEVPRGHECEWVYQWVADDRSRAGTMVRSFPGRVWRRAKRTLSPAR